MFGKDTRDYEGFNNKIYYDTEGYPTIGYGHKIPKKDLKSGKFKNGISREYANKLYAEDMNRTSNRFFKKYPQYKDYPKEVKTALIDASFNMGEGFLDKFKNMKRALDQKNYPEAATQLLDSKYAEQVGQRAKDNAMRIASAYNYQSSPGLSGNRYAKSANGSTLLPPEKKRVILRDITPPLGDSGLGGTILASQMIPLRGL
jgi:lysozyme